MPRIEQQRHKNSPAHGSNEAGTLTEDGKPLFRVNFHQDARVVTVERSQELGEPYAVWKDDGDGKHFRLDPMTIEQMENLQVVLGMAIRIARKATR